MKNLLNPKWIFILNTLPVIIRFILFIGQYNIIKSLLDEDVVLLWKTFGWILGILGILNFLYAVFLVLKKTNVSAVYSVIALVFYISFIYCYTYFSDDLMPFTIPRWMMSGEMFVYVGTFLMPTLAYSLFVLVFQFTSKIKDHKAWKNFLAAFLIPAFWYVFFLIILPLWQPVNEGFSVHALLILIIIGTLFFLFFLIRAVYIIGTKNSGFWLKNHLYWKIPITIILPLLGLAINNGLVFSNFLGDSFIFGDLSNPWFYFLAFINGLLICLPNSSNKKYRLILFAGRSIAFSFSLYFFIVFLPFLPFSVLAIIAIGIGFLMLTPLLVFVIHINTLTKDFIYLKTNFSTSLIKVVSIIGALIIPLIITFKFINEKSVLQKGLDYIYSPDYSKKYQLNKTALQSTLKIVRSNKDRSNGALFGNQTPYLSTYYNWLVLDNLSLSESKINQLEKIFFNKNSVQSSRSEPVQNESVCITDIITKSQYDTSQNAWVSWIDLELTNQNSSRWVQEFKAIIDLPTGSWISDYYLYVGEKKEMGILAEKKSAMWIYSQIRNENKDPGILHYLTGNKVMFKVFPFAENEVRKTGIEIIHKESITLSIDGNLIDLGNEEETVYENVETDNTIYISSNQKEHLKKIKRKPYFHFIVDASEDAKDNLSSLSNKIEKVIERNQLLSKNAKISFVNTFVATSNLDNNWKQQLTSQVFNGGFYLDRAIKKTLVNSYQNNKNTYPVIVVVTNDFYNSVLISDFSDLKVTFPDNDLFYVANEDGKLEAHSLHFNSINRLRPYTNNVFGNHVLEYIGDNNKTYYLQDNHKSSIILKNDVFETSENEIKKKNWESALTMQGMWTSQILHPETSHKEWLSLVKYSFTSKIMTPVTSYLVVENEAQKAMLKKKQEQVLSGNKSLDIETVERRMSEPNTILLLVLFGLVISYIENRKRRINKKNI